ncbi:MAG: hypothetical protein EBS19_06775, partial [Spirochaetia bacterium]|nr:hypothetical protein [Spirochaetia bacterium]
MKDKIRAIYEGAGKTMPEEIGVYNFGNFGADRNKLLFLEQGFEKSPEFLSLSLSDQKYLLENWKRLNGFRSDDATVTLGSTPYSTKYIREPKGEVIGFDEVVTPAPEFKFYDPRTWKNYRLKPTVSYEPKYSYPEGVDTEPVIFEEVGREYKLPEHVGGVQGHEGGHDMQKFYEDWGSILDEYKPKYGYGTVSDKNPIAREFKNAMVKPTIPKAGEKYTTETWKSSFNELHSELMRKRLQAAKNYMNADPNMTMKDAIDKIKKLEAEGDPELIDNFYLSDADGWDTLNKHFKPSTPIKTKRKLIQMLPGVVPTGIGVGAASQMQGQESNAGYKDGGIVLELSQNGGSVSGTQGLTDDFARRLTQMILDGRAQGINLNIGSGYRSYEKQKKLWEQALKKYGSPAKARKWVAPPGGSFHNKGLAVDLSANGRFLGKSANSKATEWAHANAKKYGLHFRMGHEPWHIEPIEKSKSSSEQENEHDHINSDVYVNNQLPISQEEYDQMIANKNLEFELKQKELEERERM